MTGSSLASMAWRNLWRHRRRTLLTLSSIAFGTMLAVLFTGMGDSNFSEMIHLAARMVGRHRVGPGHRECGSCVGEAQSRLDLHSLAQTDCEGRAKGVAGADGVDNTHLEAGDMQALAGMVAPDAARRAGGEHDIAATEPQQSRGGCLEVVHLSAGADDRLWPV